MFLVKSNVHGVMSPILSLSYFKILINATGPVDPPVVSPFLQIPSFYLSQIPDKYHFF